MRKLFGWLFIASLLASAESLVAQNEYPCDPNPQPGKESELAKKLAVQAIKKAGGFISEDAAKVAGAIEGLGLNPITAYATTKDPQAVEAGLAAFMKGAGEIAFPELAAVLKAGDILAAGGKIAVEALYEEGQRQQFEAMILGGGGDSPLGIINNLYARDPFFGSGPLAHHNPPITPRNFGETVKSERELRNLWFNLYGNHLKGGPLGLAGPKEIDERLAAGFPKLLQYWKVERVAVVLRQIRRNYADLVQRAVKEKKACDELLRLGSTPTAPKPPGRLVPGRWVLQSIEMRPDSPAVWTNSSATWDFSREGLTAHLKLYNGDQNFFAWTAPPATIQPGGSFFVSITARALAAKRSRASAVIGVAVNGFDVEVDGEMRADALAEDGQSVEANKVFKLTPRAGASQISYEVHCGVHHIYTYKLGQ